MSFSMPPISGQIPLPPSMPQRGLGSGVGGAGQVPLGVPGVPGMSGPTAGSMNANGASAGNYQSYQRQALDTYLQAQGRAVMEKPKKIGGFFGVGGRTVQPEAQSGPRSIRDIISGRKNETQAPLSFHQQKAQNRQQRDLTRQQIQDIQKDQMKYQRALESAKTRSLQTKYQYKLKKLEKPLEKAQETLTEDERRLKARYFIKPRPPQ